MAKARGPDWENIKNDYIKQNGDVVLKEFAEKHGVKYSTLRSRKNRERWDDELKNVATDGATQQRDVATPNRATKKRVTKVVDQLEDADLTEKQRLFCLYYIKSFNATQSAIQAGYAPDSAHVEGYRLLRNAKVKAEIKRLKGSMQQDIFIDAMDVLNKYIEIAFADITDYVSFGQEDVVVDFDDNGEPITRKMNVVNLKDSHVVDGTILTEVSQGRDGVKVKLADKIKALEKLEKYFDLFPDRFKRKVAEEKLELERAKVFGAGEGDEDQEGINSFIEATKMSKEEIEELFKDDDNEDIQEEKAD